MSASQYSRLSSVYPEARKLKFTALDGPSYFTYGVPAGKYSSAFTYSHVPSSESTESLIMSDDKAATETRNVHGHGGYDDLASVPNMTDSAAVSLAFRLLTYLLSFFCYLLFVVTLPFSAFFMLKRALPYERFVVFRLGRLLTTRGPGYVVVFPCIDRWIKVDLRTKAFSVPPLKAITVDGASIEIGAEVYYRVKDPVLSVSNVQDLNHAIRILCQTLLQKYIGKQNLCDIETDRTSITDALMTDVNMTARTWGVEVGKIELPPAKVHSQPNPLFNQTTTDVLNCLSSVLFPPGVNKAPIEQFQNFYQMALGQGDNRQFVSAFSAQREGTSDAMKPNEKRAMDLLAMIQPHVNSSLVKEFDCAYKFFVSDDSNAIDMYFLDLKNGEGKAGVGDLPDGCQPDVSLQLSSSLLADLIARRIRPFDAYMDGRLTVSGDLRAAMKLGDLFKLIAPNVSSHP